MQKDSCLSDQLRLILQDRSTNMKWVLRILALILFINWLRVTLSIQELLE